MTPLGFAFASVVVFAGAVLQGAVGFGLGMLAAPLLVMLDPALVPGPLLAAALVLTLLIAVREHAAVDLRGVGWAVAGRVPGTLLGAWVIALVPPRETALIVGAMVIVAVLLIASGARVTRTRRALLGAGSLSGFMATTASIGGPAMAILYQDARGDRIRGTLSSFFVFGLTISLGALAFVDRLGWAEVRSSLMLLPGVLVGFLISRRLAPILDRGHTRKAVLLVSALAGISVIAEALLTRS